jgi:hypothetical protein
METPDEEAKRLLEENYNLVMHLKISGSARKLLAKKNLLLCLNRQINLMQELDLSDKKTKYAVIEELKQVLNEAKLL